MYGIFAALDSPDIEEIYCMKAAQVLWTTALLAYLFNRVCASPAVMLGMFAGEGAAKKFSLTKLEPMGKATPEVAAKIDFSASRKSGNTVLRKSYDGGFLELFGSNAIWNVKSTTAHVVFVEEPDDANENVGNQGDSIKLLFERGKRVRHRKKILGGTPAVKGFSRVAEYIELSDKRVLPIRCHECDDYHVLTFENIIGWEAEDTAGEKHPVYGYNKPENATYVCPHCGVPWDDYQRKENIRATVAIAMAAGDPYCGWTPTRTTKKTAGFTELNELYSCLPGAGVESLVADYLEAEYYASRGDNTKQIVFINSKLGRPYEYEDGRDDADALRENAKADPESQLAQKVCPQAGLVITAGVDVQDNRLAIVIRAHGRSRKSWLMFADEIYAKGSTSNEYDPVWTELDKILFDVFRREDGRAMYLEGVTIDSGGHATDAVYHWGLTRQKKYPAVKILVGKGSSSITNPPVFVHPPAGKTLAHKNPNKLTKADRKGVKLYIIGTNKAKDYLAEQMSANARGENRFHFYSQDDLRTDYFDQLVAEAKIPNKSGRFVWTQKSGCACEFWDCEVYAEHAARCLKVHSMDEPAWAAIEKRVNQADLFEKAPPLIPQTEIPVPQRRESRFKRRT